MKIDSGSGPAFVELQLQLISHACGGSESIATWSAYARRLPRPRRSLRGSRCLRAAVVPSLPLAWSWAPVRPHAVTTAEVVEIDQVALFAQLVQLEYPAVVLGTANITEPKKLPAVSSAETSPGPA